MHSHCEWYIKGQRPIGVDYSVTQAQTSNRPGLLVYVARLDAGPVEDRASHGPKKHWNRQGVAEWLVALFSQNKPAIGGIDSGFPFPIKYFEQHGQPRDWQACPDDFHRHWPTDSDSPQVDFVRDWNVGRGSERTGDRLWKRVTEVRPR